MNLENKQFKRALGTEYEKKAATYLESIKYKILDKNVNYRWGEIDLVAVDAERLELVFIEVRHRAMNSMCAPEESISATKQRRLKLAINTYLSSLGFSRLGLKLNGVRIDLVAYSGDEMRHWKNFI